VAVELRRVRAGEWSRLRDLRLRSLEEDPGAFGSSLAAEVAQPDAFWERLAGASEAAQTEIVFVAEEDEEWLGLAAGFLSEADPRVAGLWGLWVAPEGRRRMLASHLVDAVSAWARARKALRLDLSVAETSVGAAALYERLGFTPTGETRALASDPSVVETVLFRVL
jgi:ribosomal protein S18 acetylase RimI-like enzyme